MTKLRERFIKHLLIVLSQDEVKKLINSCTNLKHRILLPGVYSAGLRVSEVVALQPIHIERSRMMIRVEQGKGRKDRYTILSKRFLSELEVYWREYRSEKYFFFGADKAKPMAIGTAQKIYYNRHGRSMVILIGHNKFRKSMITVVWTDFHIKSQGKSRNH